MVEQGAIELPRFVFRLNPVMYLATWWLEVGLPSGSDIGESIAVWPAVDFRYSNRSGNGSDKVIPTESGGTGT